MKFILKAAARTHTGRVRKNNEDNYYLCGQYRTDVSQGEADTGCIWKKGRFLAAVADGMGGEENGEIASLLTVKALKACSFEQIQQSAKDSVYNANIQICSEIEKKNGRRMGSTLAALYIDKEKAQCCNIGDSRCYLLRDGNLRQLSCDHNKARRMVELGVLTPEQAARHSSRHELTQHLGIYPEEMVIQPAFSEAVELQEGDIFLICSDGLTDMVASTEIITILTGEQAPEQQARKLIQAALLAGGRDNVTALVVQVCKDDRTIWKKLFSR